MLTKENFIFKEEDSRVLPGNKVLTCRINLEASIITPTRNAGEDPLRRAIWEKVYGNLLKRALKLRKQIEAEALKSEAALLMVNGLIQVLSYEFQEPVQQTKRA